MKPLLSIVIANYNYGRFLSKAIESLLSQSCQDYELIICDGGSTDNSVDIIKHYARGLPPSTEKNNPSTPQPHLSPSPITWWCSEPDGGQSNAFNKGFSHAHGKFLTWLNADDVMLPGTIEKLKKSAREHPKCEWFVGGVLWLDPGLRVFKCGRARRMSKIRALYGQVNVCGPSSFFSRSLYERAGKFDERFHYIMDTDLWLRFAIKEQQIYFPFVRYAWGLRIHSGAKMSGHKVTSDGGILTGSASDDAFEKDIKRKMQLQKENVWMRQKFPNIKIGLSRVLQVLTADHIPALISRYDTFRYKGDPVDSIIFR